MSTSIFSMLHLVSSLAEGVGRGDVGDLRGEGEKFLFQGRRKVNLLAAPESTECLFEVNSHKFEMKLLVLTRRYFLAIFSYLRAGIKRMVGFNYGGVFSRQLKPRKKGSRE